MIDAHALLWFLAGDERLGPAAREAMDDERTQLILPAIALAEVAVVVRRGRFGSLTPDQLFDRVQRDPRMTVAAVTEGIVRRADRLPAPGELHDRLIVATAIELAAIDPEIGLITRDHEIIASGLVPTIW